MNNFLDLSLEEKCETLSKFVGKKVCMTFNSSSAPDSLKSKCLTGKISALGELMFTFDPDEAEVVDTTLRIDSIESIKLV